MHRSSPHSPAFRTSHAALWTWTRRLRSREATAAAAADTPSSGQGDHGCKAPEHSSRRGEGGGSRPGQGGEPGQGAQWSRVQLLSVDKASPCALGQQFSGAGLRTPLL